MEPSCPECGAALADGRTCADDFHQLLFWENERPELGQVHHLLVLCYHLQHPSLYSAEGLAHARRLLAEFVEGGLSPAVARRRQRAAVDSGGRGWSVTARPGNHGRYEHQPAWTMRAADVVAGGMDNYVANVRAWAGQVHRTLVEGGGYG
jgi:hypothetical protein